MWTQIAAHIARITGAPFVARHQTAVGGGCINGATLLADGGRRYFVKHNMAARLDMFQAEAAALTEIRATDTLYAPEPICWGTAADQAYLVLEYLDLQGTREAGDALGQQLAALHRIRQPYFGWSRNNTIGSTPQINTPTDDWVAFWRDQRLGYQLRLAEENGHDGGLQRLGERLLADLAVFFRDYAPESALLHGDLWSGNYGVDAAGRPVIFDPAAYYGDREADVAMTELFGGFSARFYAAYNTHYPLDAGYPVRKILYNLYHVLNHLNLFGGGYRAQAERMLERLRAETG
jgi:fructosamine-3-kinase